MQWEKYSDHMRQMLHEAMKSEYLTDVTLVSDDKRKFRAHKLVLSACSPIFKSIIDDLSTNDSVIYLRGIQHSEMESILQFIYLGVTTFNDKRVNEFLNVASNLEIKELSQKLIIDKQKMIQNDVYKHDDNTEDQIEEDSIFLVPPKDSIFKIDKQKQTNEIRSEETFTDSEQLSSSETQEFLTNEHKTTPQEKCHQEEKKKPIPPKDKKKVQDLVKNTESTSKIPCNKCNLKFSQVSDLGLHIRKVHNQNKVGGSFMKKNQKIQESSKKTEEEKTKFRIGSSSTNMKLEKKVLKLDSISFSCNQCEYVGNSPGNLKLHIRRDHEGDKAIKHQNAETINEPKKEKFQCEKCDYQTTLQSNLKEHIERNHEVKIKAVNPRQPTSALQVKQGDMMTMFPCKQCDFQTISPETLKNHILNKHENEKFQLKQVGEHNERFLAVSFDS